MTPMVFVWRSPDAPGPRMLPGETDAATDEPVPGIRQDAERDGLCWGRREADPDERYWRVHEAATLAVGTFDMAPHMRVSARLVTFEQRLFRLDGRTLRIFVGPGVDVERVVRSLREIRES